MIKFAGFLTSLLLLTQPMIAQSPNTLTEEEKEDGWILLFDGQSAEHWRGYNMDSFPEGSWAVEDGALVFQPGSYSGPQDIITKEKFGNFV